MATVNPVPTLSMDGYVTASAKRMDYLLVYFFTSDFLQSTVYKGKISSLPWILKEYPRDMNLAAAAVRRQLNTYLSAYYDSVSIDIDVQDSDPTDSASKTTMTIGVTVSLNGETFQAWKLLNILDGKLTEFADLNNSE